MTEFNTILQRADSLKQKYAERDRWAKLIRAVREGRWTEVNPDVFNEQWPAPTVANMIEVMARDFAASAAAMPAINCSSANMTTDTAKDRAQKRTRIANHYAQFSRLAAQLPDGMDNYQSYGMLALCVTPDMDAKLPTISVEDSQSVYPVFGKNMCTESVLVSRTLDRITLETRYPQVKEWTSRGEGGGLTDYEVLTWNDKTSYVTWIPRMSNMILHEAPNPLGRCYYVCIPRPSGAGTWDGNFRGAYNDLIWPQLARHNFQMLAMSAAEQAVDAPIAVPTDVADVPMGPGAIIRTQNPQGVGRVKLDVPQGAWQALENLQQDMILGGMTSAGRLGQAGSGWTTGQGQDALGEGYSSQVALAQAQVGWGIQLAEELCFAWDEALWPDTPKQIRGMEQGGAPYQLTYTPSKDIAGDYTCDVSYGFMAGLDANRALIWLLQASAGGYISRDYAMRQMPQGVDALAEQQKINAEKLGDGLIAALAAIPQALPQMVLQGADPTAVITAYAKVIEGVKKGQVLEDAVEKAFAPQAPPAPPAAPVGPPSPDDGSEQPGAGGQPMPGMPDTGARPPLNQLQAGLSRGGSPDLGAIVSHQTAANS